MPYSCTIAEDPGIPCVSQALAPRVWLAQMGPIPNFLSDDDTLLAHLVLAEWGKLFGPAFAASGRAMGTGEVVLDRLRAAGFVNVQEKRYKCPVLEWAKKPVLKVAGWSQVEHDRDGMEVCVTFYINRQPEA